MDPQNLQTLILVLTVFVIVAAVAMVMQVGILFGTFMVTRRLEKKLAPLIPKAEALLPKAEELLASSGKTVTSINQFVGDASLKVNHMLDVSKAQFDKVDTLLTDASGRAKVQMDRAELVLDDTMSRTQQAVAIIHRGVVTPVREVQGVVSGVRAAFAHLGRSRRPSVDHVTADEEMFI